MFARFPAGLERSGMVGYGNTHIYVIFHLLFFKGNLSLLDGDLSKWRCSNLLVLCLPTEPCVRAHSKHRPLRCPLRAEDLDTVGSRTGAQRHGVVRAASWSLVLQLVALKFFEGLRPVIPDWVTTCGLVSLTCTNPQGGLLSLPHLTTQRGLARCKSRDVGIMQRSLGISFAITMKSVWLADGCTLQRVCHEIQRSQQTLCKVKDVFRN